ERVAPEGLRHPLGQEALAGIEELATGGMCDVAVLLGGPPQLEDGRIVRACEAHRLSQLEPDVIGGVLDLLGPTSKAEVLAPSPDVDALSVDIGALPREPV